ncbi:MAG: hypothetical protein Kow00120_27770 [Anaerolineae bacterium]
MRGESAIWYRVLAPLFPPWARLGHPIFTWELERRRRQQGRATRWAATAVFSLLMLALLVAVVDAHGREEPLAPNVISGLWIALLAPHVLLRVAAAFSTAGSVNREVEVGTWDRLRATAMPTRDVLGAKWAAGLWSVGAILVWVLALRGVLVLLLLSDLARFRGHYLLFLVESSQPPIPWVVGVLAVAAGMTASVMQPAISAGLDAATGLAASAFIKNRGLAQVFAALVRLAMWIGAVALSWPVIEALGWEPVTAIGPWLLVLLFCVEGDMALGLLMIDWLAQLYGDVDWGFALGPAALALVLVQAGLAVLLIRFSGWRAARLGERA